SFVDIDSRSFSVVSRPTCVAVVLVCVISSPSSRRRGDPDASVSVAYNSCKHLQARLGRVPSTSLDFLMEARAPAVVAVVITTGPAPTLRATLASLAAQDYDQFSVLVLENGEA